MKIANVLAHYWRVDLILFSGDYRSQIIVWLPHAFKAKIEKESLRYGWTIGKVAGSRLLASFEDETLPRDVQGIMDDLAMLLPEEVDFGGRMSDDVLSLVQRLRAEFLTYEGIPDRGLLSAEKNGFRRPVGLQSGLQGRAGRDVMC